MATPTEAMKPKDLARVVVDTTVQPKAVMFPTDTKLLNRARERLVRLAAHVGVELRQSCARVGKLTLIKHQSYAHAHQFKRAAQAQDLSGRVIRDIGRRIHGDPELEEIFARPLSLSRRVLVQDQRQRGPKLYSRSGVHRQGQGASAIRVRVKVSVASTARRSKGGQFVTYIAALPGNPYDGHTLATVIPTMENMIGNTIERLLADAGYPGHNAPTDYKFRVYVRPEAPAHTADQTRAAAARRHRTSDRSSQGRAPHEPQLSCTPCRRCR